MAVWRKVLECVPPRVVELPAECFVDAVAPVRVGLRLPAERDLQAAKTAAAQLIARHYRDALDSEEAIEAFNHAIMRHAVGLAMVHPDDARRTWFELPEAQIGKAMTPEGIRRAWDELEALRVDTSPLYREATADDAAELAQLVAAGFGRPSDRRLVAYALDRIRAREKPGDAE